MFMSVVDAAFEGEQSPVVTAKWDRGSDGDHTVPLGTVWPRIGAASTGIGFVVTRDPLSGPGVLDSAPVTLPADRWALRVDEVAFPVGAVAHCHTHTGSGWRVLVEGSLRLEMETNVDTVTVGARWYEPAGSPVRAVALQTTGVTRFVRCMIIPHADLGRSTFRLENAADADRPRLQITHRHLDIPVQVEAG